MTAKEYLRQSYRLDQKIDSDIAEVAHLRDMATSVSSLVYGDKVQVSRSVDPPFVRCIDKIITLEAIIDKEIALYVALKEEIRSVIAGVSNTDEQMTLRYRYIHNYTWEQIGVELNADARTVRRWHDKAITHVVLPENPIQI